MATGADYTTRARVLSALYAGMGMAPGDPAPDDATRDERIDKLITDRSRDFDREVAGPRLLGLFAPKYETRTFSGQGSSILAIDPVVAVSTVQYLQNPGQSSPNWQDISSEIGTYKMGLLPADDAQPVKQEIFRQQSWYVDPFPLGNIRVTGLWGVLWPDPLLTPPSALAGLTSAQISALAPVSGGWWATPDDVQDAVTQWVVFSFEQGKAAYSEQPGSPSMAGTQDMQFPSKIPDDVQRIIARYRGEDSNHPKLALVGNDVDATPSGYRWRDWLTTS